MSVDPEGSGYIRVPHQFLGGLFVHSRLIQQRSVGVPELMQRAADAGFFLKFRPTVSADAIRNGAFAVYRKKIIIRRPVRDPVKEELRQRDGADARCGFWLLDVWRFADIVDRLADRQQLGLPVDVLILEGK